MTVPHYASIDGMIDDVNHAVVHRKNWCNPRYRVIKTQSLVAENGVVKKISDATVVAAKDREQFRPH